MTPELFVPSVPWRLPALLELVSCLARQTTGARVHFVLDGHTPEQELAVVLAATKAALDHDVLRGPPGAGARWRLVDAIASSLVATDYGMWEPPGSRYSVPLEQVLVLSLDDDLLPGRLYVQRSLEAWERLKEPFSWCGSRVGTGRQDYIRMTAAPAQDAQIDIAGAGGMVVPAKLLRGISDDVAADRFFGPRGHDEALVSWWLTVKHRVHLWRPRGAADVREHALAHDPRSQWRAAGDRCSAFVEELEARGWPPVDPPKPHDPYAGFRGRKR